MAADEGTIQKLCAWEGHLLAIIGGLRKKASEDWTVYAQRRLRYCRHHFARYGFQSLVQRFLRKQFDWAKDVASFACPRTCAPAIAPPSVEEAPANRRRWARIFRETAR
eukprot:631137-Pyramimonas_sp.AAC.1